MDTDMHPDTMGDIMPPGLYCMDCMDAMRTFPDRFFDLAIVDPPYGCGFRASDDLTSFTISGGGTTEWDRRKRGRFGGLFDRYHIGADDTGRQDGRGLVQQIPPMTDGDGADIRHWDVAPPPEYFTEMARVSKNQIIWGGNYFDLPPTRCFVVWDKCQGEDFSMAMCEYAWTSFNANAKLIRMPPMGTSTDKRFHPTQKPVKLYSWLLGRYAKDGMRILDTHAGSASSLVACERAGGMQAWGFEIDQEYYRMASARLAAEKAQINLFDMM